MSDFSIESVTKIINFLHTGKTFVNTSDVAVSNEIKSLIDTLEIDVDPFILEVDGETKDDLDLPGDRIRGAAVASASRPTGKRHNPTAPGAAKFLRSVTTSSAVEAQRTEVVSSTQTTYEVSNDGGGGQFSCQFCGAGFEDFPDLSKHVRRHFLEPESVQGEVQEEQSGRRANGAAKVELDDQTYSGPEIVSVLSIPSSVEASEDFGQLPKDWDVSERRSCSLSTPGSPVKKKPRLIPIPSSGTRRTSNASRSRRCEGSDVGQTSMCWICKAKISDTPAQVLRHLAMTHFARHLQNEFGPTKANCSKCGKFLKTRRGYLTHMFNQHSKLPKNFAALKKSIAENKITFTNAGGKVNFSNAARIQGTA